eukprot:1720701-Heterocapsa_arctica.AAC.1
MGFAAKHTSVDKDRDGIDLLAAEPYNSHFVAASRGEVDGAHAGYPCSSFSRLRFRPMPGMLGPVRNRQH